MSVVTPAGTRWFYVDGRRVRGPFTAHELRQQVGRGSLPADRQAWHDGAGRWRPLGEALALAGDASAAGHLPGRGGAPRPVRRYLARLVDTVLFGALSAALALVFAYVVAPEAAERALSAFATTPGRAALLMLVLFAGGLFAAIPVGLSGTSPGKWMFGIELRDEFGGPPGLRRALRRELRVFTHGLAAGIPLVSLLSLGFAYRRLVQRGSTTWDDALRLHASYRPLRPAGFAIVVLLASGVLLGLWA